ncbi:MAG: outer membrane beta-barrel protein [Steroidobacteraceae bacterium]
MTMSQRSGKWASRHVFVAALAIVGGIIAAQPAHAQVPGVDFYLGAGVGTGNVAITDPDGAVGQFKEDHTAFKFYGGVRAASFGAELEYMNFGSTSGDFGADTDVNGKLTGVAGFGVLYLPLPLPVVDVYGKAGFARLNRKITDLTPGDFSTKDTEFAYGGGVQVKLGSFALRAEYERFNTDGKDPTLLTLGASFFFL